MRQTTFFTKTRKEIPSDEISKNAGLLIRAGYIHKEMAGVYSFLPLGLRVLEKIVHIIRNEMNALGSGEVSLSSLQDKALWEKTGRWGDKVFDVWFKTKLKNGSEIGLAPTHEEPLTAMVKNHVSSYRDLPLRIFQFQTKFRNEIRSKSGLLRTREFLMKDLYSFSRNENEHNVFYEEVKEAYRKIFNKVGIGDHTFLTLASGGSFSKFSHEFQAITEAGEDIIFICEKCDIAINKEIINEQNKCPKCGAADFREEKAVEVGNIFNLGTKFSDALGLTYLADNGKAEKVIMGSYGIGLPRLMGAIVEILSDDKGIVWPGTIAPFDIHLIGFNDNPQVKLQADNLYSELRRKGVDVFYDDRDARAGEKFADADLIGIPYRLVVSEKTIKAGAIEIKARNESKEIVMPEKDFWMAYLPQIRVLAITG